MYCLTGGEGTERLFEKASLVKLAFRRHCSPLNVMHHCHGWTHPKIVADDIFRFENLAEQAVNFFRVWYHCVFLRRNIDLRRVMQPAD
jgi:hypothetical protein